MNASDRSRPSGKGNNTMNFSDRLIELRKNLGLTQEDLAERVGVSRQSISKWETGESMPDLAKAKQLADTFGISMDVLCARDELDETAVSSSKDTIQELSAVIPAGKKYTAIAIAVAGTTLLLSLFALLIRPVNPLSNTFWASLNRLLFGSFADDYIFPVVCAILSMLVVTKKIRLRLGGLLILASVLTHAFLNYYNDSQPVDLLNILFPYAGNLLFKAGAIWFGAMLIHGIMERRTFVWVISILGILLPFVVPIVSISSIQYTTPAFILAYTSASVEYLLFLLLIAYDWLKGKQNLSGKEEN